LNGGEIHDTSARAKPPAPVIHWSLLFILLCVQFALFHRHATREIVWAYPRHCDQAVYLDQAYTTHFKMVHEGPWAGLAYGSGFRQAVPSPNGALLHLQAALLFFIGGPSRMTALSLLFGYFAAFEAMFFATLYGITRRWSIAWIGASLLLAARTTFQDTGGIMDFRPDLPAMCVFGIFICCVMRSKVFLRPGWSALAGIAAAYTMAFRFLALAYFIPIFALTLILLLVCWGRTRRRGECTVMWKLRLRNLFIAGLLGSIFIAPVLIHHKASIANYYLRLHAAGQERYERAAMFHVTGLGASLKYYPQSLYLHHLGAMFLALCAALLAIGALIPISRRFAAVANAVDRRLAIAFSLIAMLVPLTVLTWDVDKNPSVGDIMVPPVLWLVLLLARFPSSASGGFTSRRWRIGYPAVAMACGIGVQVFSYLQHSELSRHRKQTASILAMYDAIGASSAKHGWSDPVVTDDAFSDYQFAPVIDVMVYERHGRLIHAHEALANVLLARSPDQMLSAIKGSDFVVLSEPRQAHDVQDPFERSTQAMHAELMPYCRSHLDTLYVFSGTGRDVTVFVRKGESLRSDTTR
jgi:hypothetical protein